MHKSEQLIAKAVNDGSYFQEMKNWYFAKYIMPSSHKALLVILTALSCLILYAAILQIAHIIIQPDVTYLNTRAVDQEKYFPIVKSLYKPHENINVSIARYFCELYVKNREIKNYHIDDTLADPSTKIAALSSHKVFSEYELKQEELYKQNSKIEVIIDKIEFSNDKVPEKASILFTLQQQNEAGEIVKVKKRANMRFNMVDHNELIDRQEIVMPNNIFLVVLYESEEL